MSRSGCRYTNETGCAQTSSYDAPWFGSSGGRIHVGHAPSRIVTMAQPLPYGTVGVLH